MKIGFLFSLLFFSRLIFQRMIQNIKAHNLRKKIYLVDCKNRKFA